MFRQSLTRLYRTWPITCPPPYRSNLSRYFSQPQTRPFSSSITRGVHVRFSSPNPTLDPNGNHDKTIKIAAVLFGFGTIYYVAKYVYLSLNPSHCAHSGEHQSSLEQVPETGRWRFMNTGHKGEEQMAEIARRQSQEAYRDIALPPHHPLSQHVRRVVSRILAASNLGVIRGVDVLYSSVGGAGGDGWDPDAEVGARGPGWVPGQEREWDVMVVNDPKVVNAEVVPGKIHPYQYMIQLLTQDTPGLIIVYTGILPVCRDEQGLAAVLSHGTAFFPISSPYTLTFSPLTLRNRTRRSVLHSPHHLTHNLTHTAQSHGTSLNASPPKLFSSDSCCSSRSHSALTLASQTSYRSSSSSSRIHGRRSSKVCLFNTPLLNFPY